MPISDFTSQLARAIADPGQILPRAEGESVARWGARAVEATLAAAEKEFIDGQVAQANILGWNMDSGVTDLQVSMALDTAAGLVGAAKTFLTATGAENYVEQHIHDRETGERYTITIQRPGKKTPHELRRKAEAERDSLARRCAVRFEETQKFRIALDQIRELHTDSVAGFCPSCFRAADVSETDDGLVAYPCPTLVAIQGVVDLAELATRPYPTEAGEGR